VAHDGLQGGGSNPRIQSAGPGATACTQPVPRRWLTTHGLSTTRGSRKCLFKHHSGSHREPTEFVIGRQCPPYKFPRKNLHRVGSVRHPSKFSVAGARAPSAQKIPDLALARIIHRGERRERGEEDRVTRCVRDRELCPRTSSPDLLPRNSLVHPSLRSLRSPR